MLRRTAIMLVSLVMLLTLDAAAQEDRSEISLQGTGVFTRDTNGNGISRAATDTGGFLVGYRCGINRWLSTEGNYGFDRNTQKYVASLGQSGIQADIHQVTVDFVLTLTLRHRRV